MVLRTKQLKLCPGQSSIYTESAEQLLKQKQYKKAKQKFKRAIPMCRNPSSLYDDWQATLYSAREFEEAILFGEKYLDKFKSPNNTQNTLGACFLHLGDYENAIKRFQIATQKESFGSYYFNWGLGLYLQGKKKEALEMYEKADQIGGFSVGLYQRELDLLRKELEREENKIFEDLIKKKIEAFEYFLEMSRRNEDIE